MAKEKVTKAPVVGTPTHAAPAAAAPAAPAATAEEKAAARAQRDSIAANDRFVFVTDLTKGAPQAKGIVNILKAAGEKGLTRKDLVEKMNGVIVTRQPQARILGYYQKDLVAAGAIKVEKAESAAPVAAAA